MAELSGSPDTAMADFGHITKIKDLPGKTELKRLIKQAKAAFDHFIPSHRRGYIEWILEAKCEETTKKRIEACIDRLVEGKSRHWKYQR